MNNYCDEEWLGRKAVFGVRILRRHLPPDKVEQPRMQINGLAVRKSGAEKEQRNRLPGTNDP